MTNKILSVVPGVFVVLFYFQSLLQPNDPIFLLKSNNLVINLALVALALSSIYLVFITKFLRWQIFLFLALVATALSIFSIVGIVDTHLSFKWPFELLDYFLILQFGITFGIGALSVDHDAVPIALPRIRIYRLSQRLSEWWENLPQNIPANQTPLRKS
jgi:hypothetical protein